MAYQRKKQTFRLTSMKGLLGLTAAVFSSTIVYAHGEPVTVYKETFGFCTSSLGQPAAQETGWAAYKAGARLGRFGNLKVFSYGSTQTGGSVNSGPIGLSQGYAFWYKPVYGLSVVTSEFPFDVSLLRDHDTLVEYQQRLSGANELLQPNSTQLAFLIDNTWYISKQSVPQARFGIWSSVSVAPASLDYGLIDAVADVGTKAPASYGASLPETGRVLAFGVFLAEVNGRVRIDNMTIKTSATVASSLATTVQQPSVAACPEGSPDRTGSTPPPVPTPGPDGDGGDGGDGDKPEQEKPDEPLPVSLCTGRQQGGYGRVVRLSAEVRAKLVRATSASTVGGQRDRTFITIMSTRPMPIGALVNVTVADFNPAARTIRVKLRPTGGSRRMRLSTKNAAMLSAYLNSLGVAAKPSYPIFSKVGTSSSSLNLAKAACVGELTSSLVRRARAAKVRFASLVVK
jgi:hypothetical protein